MGIEDFIAWVREHGTPADVKIADSTNGRTTVIGLLALKKGGRLTPADVAEAARLARDARIDPTALVDLLRLGELLLEFQSPAPPRPREARTPSPEAAERELNRSPASGTRPATPLSVPAAPAPTRTPPPPSVTSPPAPARTPPPPSATAPPAPARTPPPPSATAPPASARTPPPPRVAPAATASVPPVRHASSTSAESTPPVATVATPVGEPLPPAPVAGAPRRSSGRWILLAAAGAALAAGAAFVLLRPSPTPPILAPARPPASSPATPAAAADPILKQFLALNVALPPGWSHFPRSGQRHDVPGGVMPTALLHRGAAEAPSQSAFVGVLPLAGDLRKGAAMSDRDLLAATRNGDTAMGMELAGVQTGREAVGCELVKLASRRTGLCAGAATLGQDRYAMRTYLALGKDRALLFVFLARADLATAKTDAETLVATLGAGVPL